MRGERLRISERRTRPAFLAAVVFFPALPLVSGAGHAQPANDGCAGAVAVFDGTNGPFSNLGATDGPVAASCGFGGSPGHKDVWFSYVATCTGTVEVHTCDTSGGTTLGDTVLSAYDACGGTELACNDDAGCGPLGYLSSITLPVTAGSSYRFRVASWSTKDSGTFNLTVTCNLAMGGDDCTGAGLVFDGLNGPFDNTFMTDGGVVASCGFGGSPGYKDIWFRYVATCTGLVMVETCDTSGGTTLFDTILTAYDACGGPELACNDDASCGPVGFLSSVTFPATAGTTYYLRVASWAPSDAGTFNVTIACILPPPNDECVGAIPLSDGLNPGFSNLGATTSSPWPCAAGGSDVWFSYVASCTGGAIFSLCPPGSGSFDSAIEVFAGGCGALSSLGCNGDSCGTLSQVAAAVTAGTTYFVRVGGFAGAQGTFDLNVSCVLSGANDECAGAIPIANGLNPGFSNLGATTSFPWPCASGGSDVWFSYVASCTGITTFSLCFPGNANYDSAIEVFAGGCGALASLGCNDNFCGPPSQVIVSVAAGTTYFVRVGGSAGAQGIFDLNVSCIVPLPNDECSGAIPVVNGLNPGLTNVGATNSGLLANCFANSSAGDVWYSYVATCTGSTTFKTCPPGSATFPSVVGVYGGTCGALSFLACNFPTCPGPGGTTGSTVTVSMTAGTTYYVRVRGLFATTGSFDLLISNTGGAGSFAVNPTGCGATTITAAGSPTLGGTVSYTLSGITGTPILWVGLPLASPSPLCAPAGCALGAPLFIVLPGVSSLNAAVPCDLSLIGGTVAVQGADLGGIGGCPAGLPAPSEVTVTDTVNTTIG